MVIISLELTRVNPDRNIFSVNVELTSTVLLYRGLVHQHHRILNILDTIQSGNNKISFVYKCRSFICSKMFENSITICLYNVLYDG